MSVKRIPGKEDYVFESKNAIPLQVTRWTEQRVGVSFNGVSDRIVLPAGAELVELTATENCYLNFGDVTVVATTTIVNDESRLYLAGVQVIPVPIDVGGTDLPFTHVAVIRESVDGVLQAEQVE